MAVGGRPKRGDPGAPLYDSNLLVKMYFERVRDADKLQCSPVQHAAGVLGQSAYLAVSTRPTLDLWQPQQGLDAGGFT